MIFKQYFFYSSITSAKKFWSPKKFKLEQKMLGPKDFRSNIFSSQALSKQITEWKIYNYNHFAF